MCQRYNVLVFTFLRQHKLRYWLFEMGASRADRPYDSCNLELDAQSYDRVI